MPKWKKNATQFTVSVNHNETRGYQSSIPKPIIEALGNPEKIIFKIDNGKILVESEKARLKKPATPKRI